MTRRPPKGSGYATQVEGRRAVRELLRAGRRRVRTVWVAATGVDDIVELARDAGAQVCFVDGPELDRRARSGVAQRVVAAADPIEAARFTDLLANERAFLVALDGVTDPQNLGAVIRIAETSGATGVVVPRHRAAPVTPTVVKAAAGAIEYVPIAFVSGIPAALSQAERAGVWSVGLEAGTGTSIYELGLGDRPLVLVLGSEGAGLARLTRERCDVLAHIPLHGRIESLNVAAATAVVCSEVARTRSR